MVHSLPPRCSTRAGSPLAWALFFAVDRGNHLRAVLCRAVANLVDVRKLLRIAADSASCSLRNTPSAGASCRKRSRAAYSPRCGSISRIPARIPSRLGPMDTIALLSHNSPDAVVAYRAGVPITAQRFLSDAEHLARDPARERSRVERLRRSISFHGGFRRLSHDGARQPAAVDPYSEVIATTDALCAGCILFDR